LILKFFGFGLLLLGSLLQANTCENRILVAGLGDILIHEALQIEAHRNPEKFFSIWKNVAPYVSAADIAYGNLESPVAMGITAEGRDVGDIGFKYDKKVYSGTDFKFNLNPEVIADVQKLGVDIVSTANNHALDRKAIGIDRTILELNRQNLLFTGTRLSNGQGEWGQVTRAKGKEIFWLSCTDHLNGHPDNFHQVLKCFADEKEVTEIIQDAVKKYDAVILTPHWGNEYVQIPNARQRQWATKMAGLGVTAIIGNHPHVMQPVQRIGNMVVAYSLGNFVAWQKDTERKTSVILFLDLRENEKGKLQVAQFKSVPTFRNGLVIYPAFEKIHPAALQYVSKHLGRENIILGKDFSQITTCP
jgi:hypothetical protein